MPRTKPKEHARRTRALRRRELTRKLVEAAKEPKTESATEPKGS